MTDWHWVTRIQISEDDEITAEGCAEAPSPWFSGHFPGDPVLPGIAQLSMVLRAIEEARACPLRVSAVRRVRFKQVIRPGDALRMHVKPIPGTEDAYAFRIFIDTEVACTGNLVLEKA
jgi:3-hydroxyacyl-[acyl-carrier-protein] dehydratase